MPRYLFYLAVAAASGAPAFAAECPSFGFDSAFLPRYFCEQLNGVNGQRTRTIKGPSVPEDSTDGGELPPEWMALPIVQEAWRSDPAKTLQLIQRIRDAGGRPQQ